MAYVHLPPSIMRRLAARVGCRVVRVQRLGEVAPGREGIGYEIECPSHAAKAKLLDALAWYDAQNDLSLRSFALDVRRAFGGGPRDWAAVIHRLVRDTVAFQREPKETFQDSFLTLYYGAGDCDDVSRLVVALLRILGVRARLALLYRKGLRTSAGEDVPTHVSAQALLDGRWEWLETTLAARFGEHPVAAKRRLDAAGRSDL